MLDQHIELLNELGFDTSLKGAEYFVSISHQIQELIDINKGSLDDIKRLLPVQIDDIRDYIKSLFLEDYAFFYECGKNKYFEEINKFLKSQNINDDKQIELNKKVFGNSNNNEDLILNFSMFMSNNQESKKENKKVLEKKLNS